MLFDELDGETEGKEQYSRVYDSWVMPMMLVSTKFVKGLKFLWVIYM